MEQIKKKRDVPFELVYLRHKYFRKAKTPTTERIQPFDEMVDNIAGSIFTKNIEVFRIFGMELEDIQNIGRCHVVSFIGMQGLYENQAIMDKFILKHKSIYGQDSMPTKHEIFKKEAYDLARFLKQRLQECANFCRNKNRNVIGTKHTQTGYLCITDSPKEVNDDNLMANPEYFGYKKMTKTALDKEIKANKSRGKSLFKTQDGTLIRVVTQTLRPLNYNDVNGSALDYRDTLTLKDPEELMIMAEEEKFSI
jgi:hypothetical protein